MGRIKIEDLQKNIEIDTDEMRRVRGGTLLTRISFKSSLFYPRVKFESSILQNEIKVVEAKY